MTAPAEGGSGAGNTDTFGTWMQAVSKTDAWENILTGLGTTRDKRTGGRIKGLQTSTTRDQFMNIHAGDDIAATIAELPAKEMFREWITINVDDSVKKNEEGERTEAEPDVEEKANIAKEVLQSLDDLDAQQLLIESKVWSRVYGGSLLFIGANDGHGGDLSKPLNMQALESIDFLKVFDRFDVHIQDTVKDMASKDFGDAEIYHMQSVARGGRDVMTGVPVHASRFIRFDGTLTARERMARNGGWADSIYIRLEEVLRDFGLAWGGVAHLLQDFSQAIFKMKGLSRALAADQDNLVLSRLTTMDLCRSLTRMIPIDAELEDFVRQQTPVSGLPELMDRFSIRLAAAARMPVTLMMGLSPAGLNATGKSDIRFFYDQIKASQELEARPAINRLIELIFASKTGPTKGREPENWSIDFNPLWQLTDNEQADVRKKQAETDSIYIADGVLTEEEVAMSRFGGDKYSTDTILDTKQRSEDELADDDDDETPGMDDDALAAFALNAANPPPLPPPGAAPQVPQTSHVPRTDDRYEGSFSLRAGLTSYVPRTDAAHTAGGTTVKRGICDVDGPNYDKEKCAALQRSDEWRADTVEKRGEKYVVLSQDGSKVLGTHDTREGALRQLRAIEAAKAQR